MSVPPSPRPPASRSPAGRGLHVVPSDPRAARRRFRAVWSPWLAVLGVAAHFALRLVFDSWLNAASDAKFGAAIFILALPLVFSVFALVRAIRSAPRRGAPPPADPPHKKESSWH